MANIIPFCAVRPKKGLEDKIASLPYDVYDTKEATEIVTKNPYSFLKIDRAETLFPSGMDPYDIKVYERARHVLREMIQNGEFIKEKEPCFYLYQLTWKNRSQTGLVACASVEDYKNGIIKKHENTRSDKELDRIQHVNICNAQTGPIYLAYHKNLELEELFLQEMKQTTLYDFNAGDGVDHKVWIINNQETIKKIISVFSEIKSIYIADGHHRCASAVKVAEMRKAEMNSKSTLPSDYFLSVFFQDKDLRILDYNRVVKDLNGLDPDDFLNRVSQVCEVTPLLNIVSEDAKPKQKGVCSMFLNETWYELKFREEIITNDPVDSLDVSLLQNFILDRILNIKDPKTDKRIDFVGGIRGLSELEKRVRDGWAIAFAMFPTSIEELFKVSDNNRLMPPKSTWFEPKLRSGIFIHDFQ